MAGRRFEGGDLPTPGPWLVRGEADAGAALGEAILGVEPATSERSGGWPYLIRQDCPVPPGDCPLHIATGIQRLADARLMAATPELAEMVFRLLTTPNLIRRDLGPQPQAVIATAWALLVQAAPHLEV